MDALVFMAGIVGGIFGFAEIYPAIYDFAWSGDWGTMTLPGWLGVSPWIVAVAVIAMALGLFWIAAVAEEKFRRIA